MATIRLLIFLCLLYSVYSLHTKYVDYLCVGDSGRLPEICSGAPSHIRVWMTHPNTYNVSRVLRYVLSDNTVTGAIIETKDDIYELAVSKKVIVGIYLPTPILMRSGVAFS